MAEASCCTQRFIQTNGIKMHIAEQGSGPLVLLLHGFPELWYSWRHQIPALAEAGYHVVAPDMRGYGKTEAPQGSEKYTSFHIVGDIIGLLDALNEQQAIVVGHDWGALIGWDLSLLRPDRVRAYAALSVPYSTRKSYSPIEIYRKLLGDGFYIIRFQEPGRAEADFARHDTKTLMKKFLLMDKPDVLVAREDQEITDVLEDHKELPAWITQDEIDYFAEEFSRTGFTGGLNYYRSMNLSWELKAPWINTKIQVPALFVVGDRDLVYHFPGIRDYIQKGGLAADVPKLEDVVILPSAHFIQQEKHKEINELLLKFCSKHTG